MKFIAIFLVGLGFYVAVVTFETYVTLVLIGSLFPRFEFLDIFKIILVVQMVVGFAVGTQSQLSK